ncbi:peptide-methionine (S)-S-oxide reductase MsrA [Alkalicoccus saliphilus]|nr:peptide-methionine (S)-S-oxide reductase MsrA [Alkalicoccus saliphilus]
MKKIIIALFAGMIVISAVVFIPIIYDYVVNRSYGSFPVETNNQSFQEEATFAGGCFWCIEAPFEEIEGVDSAVTGYTGGQQENPTYEEVSSGETGHMEAVKVRYDASLVTYEELLEVFWRQIDPTDPEGQFEDRGQQYSTAIFYHSEEQKRTAEDSKERLEESGIFEGQIVTDIRPAETFYQAEDYHQNFFRDNAVRYEFYRANSVRDEFREEHWGEDLDYEVAYDPEQLPFWRQYEEESEARLQERLTSMQFEVTQNRETEESFENDFWNHFEKGIYVDVVSGEPLFSSTDKFESGTGHPSFTDPLSEEYVIEEIIMTASGQRREVRSFYADSHLGFVHEDEVYEDGYYVINSAALVFIAEENMSRQGYEDFLYLFEENQG